VRPPSRPRSSNSRRSWFDDTWMSIDGLYVGTTSSATRVPVSAQRVRMSLRLDPITSWSTGTPIRSAIQPEKMLPKFPVGTVNEQRPSRAEVVA
jgi:hypothetical protein